MLTTRFNESTKPVKISYLIAVYNKENYVRAAIQSILDDNDLGYELEVCIVDDGSTDHSLQTVIEAFGQNHRVKIKSFSINKGKNSAYNAAYLLATGDYIALLGADDEVTPGRTGVLLAESLRTGVAVYGAYVRNDLINDQRIIVQQPKIPNFCENLIGNSLSGGCFLAPRPILDKAFPIPESLKFEDWWISFHLLREEKVKTIPHPVTLYNIGTGNDCAAINSSYEAVFRDYSRHLPYYDKFRPYLRSKKEMAYWERGRALRKSLLFGLSWKSLLSRPLDRSWIKLVLFNIVGAKFTYSCIAIIQAKIRRIY